MHELTAQLHAAIDLGNAEIERAVAALLRPDVADTIKADFLRALREKGESAMEIAGFVKALLGHAIEPGIERSRLPAPILDVCGTGGDRMELFNVSTTSMFVLAAAGAVVVKHGNRAITSQCGGADVLEQLGVRIDLPPPDLRRCVETLGLGFVFAPNYHPAFKGITPVRKLLASQGIPTIFNMLGPLLNPVKPEYQLVGIFSKSLLPKYAHALAALGRVRAWAVHGDGADELTTTGQSDVREVTPEGIREFGVDPSVLGLPKRNVAELRGGDRRENARILVAILDGSERGAKREIVALNAGAGFVVAGLAADLPEGLALAVRQIDEGRALAKLRALQAFS
jgi:anthranilate phosphoribosyltransferase